MATQTIHKSLLSHDPRYAKMFDVEKQMANNGVDLERDYSDDMNRLRERAGVHKGSQGYKESPGIQAVGPTILSMVGTEHKRNRAVAQPLFKRPMVLSWWNKRWIQETVDALLDHYEFWEACRDDRSLLEQAVEEGLRWRATDPVFPRLCTEDTEVEGVMVPAGSRVYLCLGAANHDPKVFERPADYDIFRKKEINMGLGFGAHRCLGMDVARQEIILAIGGLMDRWPNMRIDLDQPKPRFRGLDHRGMSAVTVRLK